MLKNRILAHICELLGICLTSFVIFIPRTSQLGHRWSTLENALYLTYSKFLFTFGISLIILPTLLGINCRLRLFLDNKFTNCISKLSFMMYLIHLLVVMQHAYSLKTESYYSATNLFVLFVSHAVIATACSCILVLIVEVPMYKVQKDIVKHLINKLK